MIKTLGWENLEEREIITCNALKQEQHGFIQFLNVQTPPLFSRHLPHTPVPFAHDPDDQGIFSLICLSYLPKIQSGE